MRRSGAGSPAMMDRPVSWRSVPELVEATTRGAAAEGVPADRADQSFEAYMQNVDRDIKIARRTLDRFFAAPQEGGLLPVPADEVEFSRTIRAMARQGASMLVNPTGEEAYVLGSDAFTVVYYGMAFQATVLAAHSSACPPAVHMLVVRSRQRIADMYWNRARIDPARDLPRLLAQLRDACRARAPENRYAAILLEVGDADGRIGQAQHVNTLLVDARDSVVYHFEPHGAAQEMTEWQRQQAGVPLQGPPPRDLGLSVQLAAIVNGAPEAGLRFVESELVTCPSWMAEAPGTLADLGLQTLEPLCVVWSIFFLDACLALPDLVQPNWPSGFADLVFRALRREPDMPNPIVCLLAFYLMRLQKSLQWFTRELLVTVAGILDPGLPEDLVRGRLTEEDVRYAALSNALHDLLPRLMKGDMTLLNENRITNHLMHAMGVAEFQLPARRSRMASAQAMVAARDPTRQPSVAAGPRPPASLLRPDPGFVPMLYHVFHDAHLKVDPVWVGTPDFPQLATSPEAQQAVLRAFPVEAIFQAAGAPPDFVADNAGPLLDRIYTDGLATTMQRSLLGPPGQPTPYDRFMQRDHGGPPELQNLVWRELMMKRYLRRQATLSALAIRAHRMGHNQVMQPEDTLLAYGSLPPYPLRERNVSYAKFSVDRLSRDVARVKQILRMPAPATPEARREKRAALDQVLRNAAEVAETSSIVLRTATDPGEIQYMQTTRTKALDLMQRAREMLAAEDVAEAAEAAAAGAAAGAAGGPAGP